MLRVGLSQQVPPSPIIIDDLHVSYPFGEPIDFVVRKRTPEPVRFACAAEVLHNGKFREFRWDISKNGLKVPFRSYFDLRSPSLKVRWDIPKQMNEIRPRVGWLCRLRIDLVSPTEEHIYSTPFSIKKE